MSKKSITYKDAMQLHLILSSITFKDDNNMAVQRKLLKQIIPHTDEFNELKQDIQRANSEKDSEGMIRKTDKGAYIYKNDSEEKSIKEIRELSRKTIVIEVKEKFPLNKEIKELDAYTYVMLEEFIEIPIPISPSPSKKLVN